jgi:hypothetical protein
METNFVPDEPSIAQLVRAVKFLVADFDGRQTSRVTGTDGRPFEFFPTAITDTGGTLVALVKAILEAGAQILEILTIGEKEENHGRRHLLEETGVPLKTMLVTTLTPSEIGFRSRVVQVHLGDMPAALAEAVSEHFPAGFCRLGSGEPCS